MDEQGYLKLIDLGIAVENKTSKRQSGTLGYAAPEVVWKSSKQTYSCDLYALGIILYRLKTGIKPYNNRSWAEESDYLR